MKNRIINSSTFLLAAYFIIHFFSLGSQYIILKALNVRGVTAYFFYNNYSLPPNSWWSKTKVFLIFGIELFMVFMLLVLALILVTKLSRKNHKLKVFYNWIIVVCSAFIIASILSAPFFREASPMFTVFLWMRFQDGGGGMYILALLSLPFIPLVGYFIRTPFLKMTNTVKTLKSKDVRVRWIFKTAFIPFMGLVGVLVLFVYNLYTYPLLSAASNEGMRLLVIGAILFFAGVFSFKNKNFISIERSNTSHLSNIPLTMLVLVSICAAYVLLWLNLS